MAAGRPSFIAQQVDGPTLVLPQGGDTGTSAVATDTGAGARAGAHAQQARTATATAGHLDLLILGTGAGATATYHGEPSSSFVIMIDGQPALLCDVVWCCACAQAA
jgi:hypothetical protein